MNVLSAMPKANLEVLGVKTQGPKNEFSKKLETAPDTSKSVSSDVDQIESSDESTPTDTDILAKVQKKSAPNESETAGQRKLTRDQAMWTFLEKMQTDVGVPPEDVVAAFSKLDVDMLMASPEESAEVFLDNLDLRPEDRDKAMGLYSDLLTWRTTAGLSENLGLQGQNAQMNVLSKDQVQKRDRLEQINVLSDRFFMNGDFGRGSKVAPMQNAMRAYSNVNPQVETGKTNPSAMPMPAVDDSSAVEPMMSTLGKFQTEIPADMPVAIPADMSAVDARPMAKILGQMETSAPSALEVDIPEVIPSALPQGSQATQVPQVALQAMNAQTTLLPLEAPKALEVQSLPVAPSAGFEKISLDSVVSDSESSDDTEGDAESDGQMGLQSMGTDPLKKSKGDGTFVVGSPKPSDLEMSENIREVIRGAQVMVKDGGGQMKIKLSPEGMGELNLKVMVQNGEVKVEMITSSDETKKLLEKGLSELKSSLSAHKLSVDNVKIETAHKASEHMLQDRQESADRGFQQRFLQDFREQNQGRYAQTYGVGPTRGLSSQTNDPAANDYDSSSARKKLDRRLDLVA